MCRKSVSVIPDRHIEWVHEGDTWLDAGDTQLRSLLAEMDVLRANPGGGLVMRFVGIILHGGRTIISLPKVRVSESEQQVHRHAFRAMRHYANWRPNHHEPSPHLNDRPEKGPVSMLAAADWLIRDFQSHGLLRRLDTAHEISGAGITNWRKTVEAVHPVISRGRPVYLDTITRRSEHDNRNFGTRLHRYLLERLSLEYGSLLDVQPIVLDHEPVEMFDALPSVEECTIRIMEEQRTTFSQRGLDVLAMMLATVSALEIENSRDLHLYGSTSFHNVWEAACGHVFGNARDDWTGSLPKPVWTSASGSTQTAATFIPDLVTDLAPGELLIGDAKYFRLTMPPSLHGQPGVNDIGKQIWYKQGLSNQAAKRGYSSIQNAFLFPTNDPEVGNLGWVEMPVGQEAVDAIAIPFLPALAVYAGDAKHDPDHWRLAITTVLHANAVARQQRVKTCA